MGFQVFHNFVHIGGGLVIARLQGGKLIFLRRKKPPRPFFSSGSKSWSWRTRSVRVSADFTQVLGADLFQGVFGELGYVFLGCCAILEDHVAIGDIDGLGKVLYGFPLGLGELGLIQVAFGQGGCLRWGGVRLDLWCGWGLCLGLTAQGELGSRVRWGMNSSAMKQVLSYMVPAWQAAGLAKAILSRFTWGGKGRGSIAVWALAAEALLGQQIFHHGDVRGNVHGLVPKERV